MAQSYFSDVAVTEPHPMAALLDEIERSLQEPQTGEIRTGIVVDKRSNELLVDIGFKSEGIVQGRDLERMDNFFEKLKIGDEVPVCIVKEDKDGQVHLSISRAMAEKDWETAESLVPASQLSSITINNQESDEEIEARYGGLIGNSLKVKVIDLDRKRNRLILSERLAMREWRRKQKEQLLDSLREGEVFTGVISSIADFGAFVDLGGADGMIHMSEMSWNRITHPSEVVQVGDKVKVQVLNVDLDKRRIGLSLRRLQPEPWAVIDSIFQIGQVVRGRITKLVNFGAFARIEENGIEGLIHISELSDKRVAHPKEVVKEGEEYDLRIIRIETDKRRLGLSLKQALPPEQKVELDWAIAPSEAEATLDVSNEELAEVAA